MKVIVHEFEGCFSIDLTAENMKEAATLTRMGMNRTQEIRSAESSASESGEFCASIVFAKSKRASTRIPRRH